MKRYTYIQDGGFRIDEDQLKDAIHQLGQFEDMMDTLNQELASVNDKLSGFHQEAKTKTLSYKETFTRKLILLQMIQYLSSKGLHMHE